MRPALALAVLLGAVAFTTAQQPPAGKKEENPPRFGLPYRPKEFPQTTPKQALESVIAAADKGEFSYLVAHLLDPAFVDERVRDRARQFEPAVEAEFGKLREFQLKNPGDVTPETRVPENAAQFRAKVVAEANRRAFAQLAREVREKLADDPESLKTLRRFYRQGSFPDPAAPESTAKVGHPDVRDRAVFVKKIGDRWYVENRHTDEKAPDPKKE